MAERVEGGREQIRNLLKQALSLADELDQPLIAAFIAQAVALVDEQQEQ